MCSDQIKQYHSKLANRSIDGDIQNNGLIYSGEKFNEDINDG